VERARHPDGGQDQPGGRHPARGPRRPHRPGAPSACTPGTTSSRGGPTRCPRSTASDLTEPCWPCTPRGCARRRLRLVRAAPAAARRRGRSCCGGWAPSTATARSPTPGGPCCACRCNPRLGRLVVEGQRRWVADEAAGAGGADLRARRQRAWARPLRRRWSSTGRRRRSARAPRSLPAAAAAGFSRDRLRGLGLDGRAVEAAERARRQIGGRPARRAAPRCFLGPPASADAVDEALAMATLTGFPDRVMRRRAPGGAGGGAGGRRGGRGGAVAATGSAGGRRRRGARGRRRQEPGRAGAAGGGHRAGVAAGAGARGRERAGRAGLERAHRAGRAA
jgi:hypothetical protein